MNRYKIYMKIPGNMRFKALKRDYAFAPDAITEAKFLANSGDLPDMTKLQVRQGKTVYYNTEIWEGKEWDDTVKLTN